MKLCCKHRVLAEMTPEQAEQMYVRLLKLGRERLLSENWCGAVAMYGTAFEAAEIILMLNDEDRLPSLERYKRTALEFIYCLRNSHYQVDFQGLFEMIRAKLHHEDDRAPFGIPLQAVFNPLHDAAFAPLSEVSEWLHLLLSESARDLRAVH